MSGNGLSNTSKITRAYIKCNAVALESPIIYYLYLKYETVLDMDKLQNLMFNISILVMSFKMHT